MIRRLIAISVVISLVFSFGLGAIAQGFGNSGSRGGGMGSSGFGSSAFGSGGMGGGFGSSGFGGGGGFGNSGFGGGSGFGNSGFGGGSGFGNSGFGGGNSGFGNSGFGNSSGNGMGGQQNFIGRDANDMQATFGQMGKAGTQFFNNMNRNMNRGNSRKSTKQTAQNVAQPMRVEVKVGFTPPRPAPDQLASDIRTRLTKLLAERHMSQPTFSMEGDTAVVGGVAASDNERAVIGQLLSIEPGIRDVRNEMTIGQPAGAASDIGPAPGS